MLLIVTAMLYLMSMPAHDASRFFHREEQNMMNKKHLMELLKGQLPPSSIRQKTLASHNFSPLLCQVPPSAPNPATYVPVPRISQRIFVSHNAIPPLLGSQQKSPLPPPNAQWAHFYTLARSPASTIS